MSRELDLGAVMRRAHFAFRRQGAAWVGGHVTYQARVQGQLEVVPKLPSRASQATSAAFAVRLGQMQRGSWRQQGNSNDRVDADADGAVTIARGPVLERFENTEAGVEQSFVFPSEPADSGNLVVKVAVNGLRFAGETAGGLHFEDPSTGGRIRYGRATWIDAGQRRTSLSSRYHDGSIELLVPDAVLKQSAYPAVLDPIISPEFGIDEPVLVAAEGLQHDTRSAFGAGVHLVVWTDQRFRSNPTDKSGYLFATRVKPDGTILDPTGICVVCQNFAANHSVASDGSGFVVAFGTSITTQGAIRLVRVNGDGVVLDTTPRATGQNGFSPAIASNGTNYLLGFIGASPNLQPSLMSFTSDGKLGAVTRFGLDGTHISLAGGATDYLVAYSQFAFNQTGATPEAYALRASPTGQVTTSTRIKLPNGGTNSQTERQTAVASDGTNFFVAYLGGQAQHNAYYAHFNGSFALTGSGLWRSSNFLGLDAKFTGTDYLLGYSYSSSEAHVGVARFTNAGGPNPDHYDFAQGSGMSVSAGGGSELVAYSNTSGDVVATRVSPTLTELDTPPLLLSRAAHRQEFAAAAYNGTDYLVVWEDHRSETAGQGSDLYGARVTPAGTVRDPAGFPISSATGDQTRPAVASNGTNFFVAWQDERTNGNIYGTAVSSAGVVDQPSGVQISSSVANEEAPTIASDGADYLIAWQVPQGIRGARVSGAGALLDSTSLVIADGDYVDPVVAHNGTSYLAAWARVQTRTVYGSRIDSQGTLLDMPSLVLASSSTTDTLRRPRLASRGSEWLLTVAVPSTSSGATIARRLGSSGSVLASVPAIGYLGSGIDGAVAWSGLNYWSVWQKATSIGVYDIAAKRVSSDGAVLDSADLLVSNAAVSEEAPALAAGPSGQLLVAYHRMAAEEPYGAFRVRARLLTDDTTSTGGSGSGGSSSTGGAGGSSSGGSSSANTGGTTTGGATTGGVSSCTTGGATTGGVSSGTTGGATTGGNATSGGSANSGGSVNTGGSNDGGGAGGTTASGVSGGGTSVTTGGSDASTGGSDSGEAGEGGITTAAGTAGRGGAPSGNGGAQSSSGGNSTGGRAQQGGGSSGNTSSQSGGAPDNADTNEANDGCSCRLGRTSSSSSNARSLLLLTAAAAIFRRRGRNRSLASGSSGE